MKKIFLTVFMLPVIGLLGGCEETKRALGQAKDGPDEFAVYPRAPLTLPPQFGLRPPAPGSKRPQEISPRDSAKQALNFKRKNQIDFNQQNNSLDPELSQGERSVLELTGSINADPAIRQKVETETRVMAIESKTVTDEITFWQKKEPFGTVLDPTKEAKRIRETQALGQPLNTNNIPIIKRKGKAILEGIFK